MRKFSRNLGGRQPIPPGEIVDFPLKRPIEKPRETKVGEINRLRWLDDAVHEGQGLGKGNAHGSVEAIPSGRGSGWLPVAVRATERDASSPRVKPRWWDVEIDGEWSPEKVWDQDPKVNLEKGIKKAELQLRSATGRELKLGIEESVDPSLTLPPFRPELLHQQVQSHAQMRKTKSKQTKKKKPKKKKPKKKKKSKKSKKPKKK